MLMANVSSRFSKNVKRPLMFYFKYDALLRERLPHLLKIAFISISQQQMTTPVAYGHVSMLF